MGVDNSVSVEFFCKNFKIEINRLTEEDMEFDMIGIDASMANAFRRILIAEVTQRMKCVFCILVFLYVRSSQSIISD
jgi:DNA-directed RNA polymerases I and III subunit RPAC1